MRGLSLDTEPAPEGFQACFEVECVWDHFRKKHPKELTFLVPNCLSVAILLQFGDTKRLCVRE